MRSRDFVFWLQGYFELNGPKTIDEKETELIKRHLNLVFAHEIDPSYDNEEHLTNLDDIHSPSDWDPVTNPAVPLKIHDTDSKRPRC